MYSVSPAKPKDSAQKKTKCFAFLMVQAWHFLPSAIAFFYSAAYEHTDIFPYHSSRLDSSQYSLKLINNFSCVQDPNDFLMFVHYRTMVFLNPTTNWKHSFKFSFTLIVRLVFWPDNWPRNQFRFLHTVCLDHLEVSVGLILPNPR